jgi:hypothetical protein
LAHDKEVRPQTIMEIYKKTLSKGSGQSDMKGEYAPEE